MAREYVISSSGITLANSAVTMIFINPGTTQGIRILRVWIGQSANATSAQQRVQLVTQVTAFPTLTSYTPRKLKIIDPISVIVGGTAGAAGTCGVNASAEGAGTKSVILDDAFNVVNGWLWKPDPEEVIEINAGSASGFGVYLPVAAATLTNWAFGLKYKEI